MKLIPFLLAASATLLFACSEPPKFNSTDISGVDWGHSLALTDHSGKPRTLEDFKGKAVVLFFGYTQCPDICPTTLATMRDALKLLGNDSARVQVLFATVDPARDTQKLLADYVPWFDPSFIGLRGSENETQAAAKDFKIFFVRQPGKTPDSYSIDHSASSYAFDPTGKLRLTIRHGETPDRIAADLRLLLAGK